MTRVYAIKNNKADAATLWKNNIPFYITPAKVPYWCGWHINEDWRKAHPDVSSVNECHREICGTFLLDSNG